MHYKVLLAHRTRFTNDIHAQLDDPSIISLIDHTVISGDPKLDLPSGLLGVL
jgi:hypothetical protein